MSWLGVNLNDSLNSIKGQLSTLTREVLSEGLDSEGNDTSQVIVSADRIKELEAQCQLHKHELEESRRVQGEQEERLLAANLHASHQASLLRQQLEERELELRSLKERSEWGWEDEESSSHNHLPPSGQDHPPSSQLHQLNQQLGRRVGQLEHELTRLREAHQAEVAAIQDHHRLTLLRKDGVEESSGSPPLSPSCAPHHANDVGEEAHHGDCEASKAAAAACTECQQLRKRVAHLEEQLHQAQDGGGVQGRCGEECRALRTENHQLSTSLEELDQQHQAAIEQLLKKKSEVQEEAQQLREQLAALTEQLAQAHETTTQLQQDHAGYKDQMQAALSTLRSQLDQSEATTLQLQTQVQQLSASLSSAEANNTRLCEERDNLAVEKTKLQEENAVLVAKESTLSCQAEQDSQYQQQDTQLQETHSKEAQQLQHCLEKLQLELNEVKESESNLRQTNTALAEKNTAAAAEAANLEQQLVQTKEQVANLKQALSSLQQEKEQENSWHERLSTLEVDKTKAEEELRERCTVLEDSRARVLMLESKLQANIQELAISNSTIVNLEAKVKQAASDNLLQEVRRMLASYSQEVPGTLVEGLEQLGAVVQEAVWQRSTLEHHVSSLTQDLRHKNQLLNQAEVLKAEVERECEDLRDQLEEVQKGVRVPPEGSSRGLPTIQEEETEAAGEGEPEGEAESHRERPAINQGHNLEEQQGGSDTQALQAQIEALAEARGNLEKEVSTVMAERDALEQQLQEAGETDTHAALQAQLASLKGHKATLEAQVQVLTQEVDLANEERESLRDQVDTLHHQLDCIRTEMSLAKHERESLGQQLLLQYSTVEDRDATIRFLEGEVSSLKASAQEALSDSQQPSLQEELDTARSKMIYMDDKLDALTQTLQQVAQVLQLPPSDLATNHFITQVQNACSTLQAEGTKKDDRISELSQSLEKALTECEAHTTQVSSIQAESAAVLAEKERELNTVREQLEKSEMEMFQLREKVEEMTSEGQAREGSTTHQLLTLTTQRDDLAATLAHKAEHLARLQDQCQQTQHLLDCERARNTTLHQENEALLQNLNQGTEASQGQLQQKERQLQEQKQQLGEKDARIEQLLQQKEQQLEEQKQKLGEKDARIEQLLQQMEQQKVETSQISATTQETQEAEHEELQRANQHLQQEVDRLTQEKSRLEEEREQLCRGREEVEAGRRELEKQVEQLQKEREQMVAAITQKHQESTTYHAELQRVSHLLSQTSQHLSAEKSSIATQLAEKEAVLGTERATVASLRQDLANLQQHQEQLQKEAASAIILKTEVKGLQQEVGSLHTKLGSLEQERDQLHRANSQFNSQYQDQGRELSQVREREGKLAVECERLRQHLVAVEEGYTAEALRAEEREATLRATLTKMEEKLSNHSTFFTTANQRASVQVESLQEQLRELAAQRDEAVMRLHTTEEQAEQHQQALRTLQQVLEDFQKNQSREIAEATERSRRQLEEEQQHGQALTTQLQAVKSQVNEAQTGLAAASRLGEQLARQEQLISTLKAQVVSQEEVARKARHDMLCLKTSAEGKVDKTLLRNLMVGYFATPVDKRVEVLRVMAEVLDFSGEERARSGLDTMGTTWLSSIANFLAPPASNVRVTSKVDVLDHTSLSQAFIRFLEDESHPRPQPRLPAVQMAQQTTEKAEKKAQVKAQAASRINPFVSPALDGTVGGGTTVGGDAGSRTSSPLLTAPTPPTLPSLAPTTPCSIPPTVSTPRYLTSLLQDPDQPPTTTSTTTTTTTSS